MKRRQFICGLAPALLSAAFVDIVLRCEALASTPTPGSATDLRAALVDASLALRRGQFDPVAWQARTAALSRPNERRALARALRVERLVEHVRAQRQPLRSRLIRAQDDDRPLPRPSGIRHRLFSFIKGQAIVPHGHNNRVSLFIVLQGSFFARHYERLADTSSHIVIRPSLAHTLKPGGQTSISDLKDNVHWFTAREDNALLYSLSVDVPQQFRQQRRSGRVYLDPEGTSHADGTILAPRSDRATLRAKYEGHA